MMAQNSNLVPKCISCERTPEGGIREGVLIGKKFLCSKCEGKITRLSVDDENYAFFTERLKKVWL